MERVLASALAAAMLVAGLPHAARAAKLALVAITTTTGTIVLRLEPGRAPNTTANFLRYVAAKTYDGTSFYRTVSKRNQPQAPFEVIQGGINARGRSGNTPIGLEPTSASGLHNSDGAIAMARTSDPGSATTEFFIDLGDARYLDAGGPLGAGYAVFGHVVRGMDVVRKIHEAPAQGESLSPPVRILTVRRLP